MESYDSYTAYAVYDSFMISDSVTNYTLTFGSYTGNAGDSFTRGNGDMNGIPFSTPDRDKAK